MDKSRFLALVSAPTATSDMDTESLHHLVKEYPYFHSAYLFLLRNLRSVKDDSYEQALQDFALRVNDRKVLFNLVNNLAAVSAAEKTIAILKEETIDEKRDVPAEFQLEDEIPIVNADENMANPDANIEVPAIELGDPLQIVEEVEEKSRVIEFDLTVSESENKVNGTKNLIDNFLSSMESNPAKNEPENKDQISLIDKFITENPVFCVNKLDLSEEREDISLGSLQEDEELVSETLAHVFETQKLYDKSIAVYEKLILKFPEKSAYFASQIDNLRTKNK